MKLIVLIFAIAISGCATTKPRDHVDSIATKIYEPVELGDHRSAAVFRGTGNTYCKFLKNTTLGIKQNVIDECPVKNANKRVATVGKEIPHHDDLPVDADQNTRTLLTNPMSDKPFEKGTVFFFPGAKTAVGEFFRVFGDTIIGVRKKSERFADLEGMSFTDVFCHSNGCTQAQSAARNNYISIQNLYHMGSPWLGIHTKLEGTIHSTIDIGGDPVGLVGIVRLIHIPFISVRALGLERSGKGVQQIGAAPLIFLEKESPDHSLHAMLQYFASLPKWRNSLGRVQQLHQQGSPLPNEIYEYRLKDLTKPGVRSSFSEYFNDAEYLGFNIQRGLFPCSDSQPEKDCDSVIYVNHKLAVHQFKHKRWTGKKYNNRFHSLEDAKECIDTLVKQPLPTQVKISAYDACAI